MINSISVENMRLSDSQTIARFVPSLELMHRAAYGVFLAATWNAPVAILVGSGNNGGDGFALACILHEHNIACTVFTISEKLSPDSAFYASKAQQAGVRILPFQANTNMLKRYVTVVDCLLGTGFQGIVRDAYRLAIEEINASGAYVISVDINSGMNGDTGAAHTAVISDLTVTIGYVKNGLLTANAGAYMKRLVCVDIGIRLAYEENLVCSAEKWEALLEDGAISVAENTLLWENRHIFRCPPWLDMVIVQATF